MDIPGGVLFAVGVGDGTQDAAGVADGEAVCRDVFGDDATGAYDAARANGHAGQDDDAAAEPDVVFDGYRRGVFPGGATQGRMQRVADGVERDVGREQYAVADGNRAAIEDGAAAVGIKEAAEADAATVVAVKRRGDVDAAGGQFTEEFAQDGLLRDGVGGRDLRVVAPEQFTADVAARFEVRVVGQVRRAATHRFPGGAH